MGNGTSKTNDRGVLPKAPDRPFDQTMKKINDALEGTAKTETDGLAGCKNRGQAKKRTKERKAEFKSKQKERSERTFKMSQQWAAHRNQNADRPKKSFFGKKVEPKHWYDD